MRFDPPVSIAAAAAWLPRNRQTPHTAHADGTGKGDGCCWMDLVHGLAGPELAVRAARSALESARWSPADIDFLAHAWTHHQGHDFWSPAHYVARHSGASAAVAVGVQQMCNGGAMALELAVTRLSTDARTQRVMVTTGDSFAAPGFDRWQSDYGVVYGDGGTATLLGGPAGTLELMALATVSNAELEEMYRGNSPFTPAARWHAQPPDVRATKREYLKTHPEREVEQAVRQSVWEVVARALADADLRPDSPALIRLGLPRLNADVLDRYYRPALIGLIHARALMTPEHTGHLGAGDLLADLAHLGASRVLPPGACALLLSAGGGAAWTCAVVRARAPQGEW